jgi:hypothetical protein
MFRRSPRRTLEAIAAQASPLIVALSGSDLKRSVTKQAQSKTIELSGSHDIARDGTLSRARGGSADQKRCAGEAGHRNENPAFATRVSLVGLSRKSKHRMTQAG